MPLTERYIDALDQLNQDALDNSLDHTSQTEKRLTLLEATFTELLLAQDKALNTASFLDKTSKKLLNINNKIDRYEERFENQKENMASYMRTEVDAQIAEAFTSAMRRTSQLSDKLEKIEEDSQSLVQEIANNNLLVKNVSSIVHNRVDGLQKQHEELKDWHADVRRLHNSLFTNEKDTPSLEKEINAIVHRLREKEKDFEALHQEFFGIESEKIEENSHGHYSETEQTPSDGYAPKITCPKKPGLKDELQKAIASWDKLVLDHSTTSSDLIDSTKEKYSNLLTEIESILPGATSAALSTSFNDACDFHNKKATRWSYFFLGTLISISVTAFVTVLVATLKFDITTWQGMLTSLFKVAPVEFPLLWLAIFSAKRNKEHTRLQEEYLHKANMMKTFEGLRRELSNHNSQTAIELLLTSTINSNSYNPTCTFEKNSDPDSPMEMLASFAESTLKLSKVANKFKPTGNVTAPTTLDLPPSKEETATAKPNEKNDK